MSTPATKEEGVNAPTQGRVKWFNNKAGYGFITVSQGDHKDEDVFVHHSAIIVNQEQYRYLVQGEYVEFELCSVSDSDHKCQAGNVQGIDNGKLMCETRLDSRSSRVNIPTEERSARTRAPRSSESSSDQYRVHTRGRGPREGDEWMLVRRRRPDSSRTQGRDDQSGQVRVTGRYNSPQKEQSKSRQNRAPFTNGGD